MRLIKIYLVMIAGVILSACGTMTINGEAQNSVDGAILYTEDGVFVDENAMTWDDSLIGKNVQAKVKVLRTVVLTEADLVTEDGLHTAGRVGKTTYVSIIKYRLVEN